MSDTTRSSSWSPFAVALIARGDAAGPQADGEALLKQLPARVASASASVSRLSEEVARLQGAIDRGIIADRTSVARSLGFTRARVTQLLDLLLLAPDIQEEVLALEAVDGVEPIGERALRDVAHAGMWEAQRAAISTTSPMHASSKSST